MRDDRTGLRRRPGQPVHSAEDVRQGEIVLRTPLQRWIFFAGLVGFVLLVVAFAFGGLI